MSQAGHPSAHDHRRATGGLSGWVAVPLVGFGAGMPCAVRRRVAVFDLPWSSPLRSIPLGS
jgi:hypothetical protein